ncbi:ABC transporter permease [Nonomuraea rubra]|uniref:ABC transporter permease n=1 Tax=Nonomuraea rubra TaxID=46180 RepID=UPI00361F5714
MWSQEVLALSRRWLLMTLRERLNLLFSVLQPAVWLVFFAGGLGGAVDARVVGTADYIAFAVPGVIAFTVVGNGVTAAMPLLFDKETGYLDKLLSMPIRRSSLIVSRFVFQVGMNAVQVLVILLVALALGVRPASGPPACWRSWRPRRCSRWRSRRRRWRWPARCPRTGRSSPSPGSPRCRCCS